MGNKMITTATHTTRPDHPVQESLYSASPEPTDDEEAPESSSLSSLSIHSRLDPCRHQASHPTGSPSVKASESPVRPPNHWFQLQSALPQPSPTDPALQRMLVCYCCSRFFPDHQIHDHALACTLRREEALLGLPPEHRPGPPKVLDIPPVDAADAVVHAYNMAAKDAAASAPMKCVHCGTVSNSGESLVAHTRECASGRKARPEEKAARVLQAAFRGFESRAGRLLACFSCGHELRMLDYRAHVQAHPLLPSLRWAFVGESCGALA
eukprot:NODE_904_length_1385_cov_63.091317_g753_i0.p1 GENE.NODE_904_length_1385_cov_63.091317_g753_i0~~NODE_904_length_1385_cov_63.091317_g753_i0.p1  ORF type:complete len:276 (-),score=33.71 NODE_904_length_1385_cov_63.091317_g753_i0:557-1357(-)